jgi:sigma-B regulation protein RsbU (phosphoserine phosphatase)
MLTGVVKSAFHSAYADDYDPLAVVRRVADGISPFGADRFVTLLSVRVSAADAKLEYVNAGHEGGFITRGVGEPEALAATGPLISPVLADLQWNLAKVTWYSDSTLLLYTDGISEASEEDEFFGVDRIHSILRRMPAAGQHLLATVLEEVGRFTGGRPPADDMTLLSVRNA